MTTYSQEQNRKARQKQITDTFKYYENKLSPPEQSKSYIDLLLKKLGLTPKPEKKLSVGDLDYTSLENTYKKGKILYNSEKYKDIPLGKITDMILNLYYFALRTKDNTMILKTARDLKTINQLANIYLDKLDKGKK